MKKRMGTRWLALLLALAMACSVCGCSPKEAAEGSGGTAQTSMSPEPSKSAGPSASTEPVEDVTTDIVVIGGGAAGLTAALAAAEAGKKVILVERMGILGGNFLLSTGILQAAGSKLQAAAGIEDSPEKYYADMTSGDMVGRDLTQVKIISQYSGQTIDWLMEKGVEFSETVSQASGSTAYRAHLVMPNTSGFTTPLTESAKATGVEFRMNTLATSYVVEDGKVCGITVQGDGNERYDIRADAVILACGGFGASAEMLEKYWGKEYAAMTYAGCVGTKGEMIEEAFGIGAAMLDMDQANYGSPTVDVTQNMLVTAMVMTYGGILVGADGNRFCDEVASAFVTSKIVAAREEDYVFEIFDSQEVDQVPKIATYISMGITKQADTLEELARLEGLDPDALAETVNTYNQSVAGAEDPFGRKVYQKPIEKGPFYSIRVNAGGVMTFGGVAINEECQVLDTAGNAIPGLYAAGECIGGFRAYGYVCGDSNGHSAVTGMLAGKYAAENNG